MQGDPKTPKKGDTVWVCHMLHKVTGGVRLQTCVAMTQSQVDSLTKLGWTCQKALVTNAPDEI